MPLDCDDVRRLERGRAVQDRDEEPVFQTGVCAEIEPEPAAVGVVAEHRRRRGRDPSDIVGRKEPCGGQWVSRSREEQDVRAGGEIHDDVRGLGVAVVDIDHEAVRALTSGQPVASLLAGQEVVAPAAAQRVRSGAAEELVGPLAAEDQVVGGVSNDLETPLSYEPPCPMTRNTSTFSGMGR